MTFDIDEARFIINKLKEGWEPTVNYLGEIRRTKALNHDYYIFDCLVCGKSISLPYTHYGLFEGNCYNCIGKKEKRFAYVAMAVPFCPYISVAYSYFRFFYPQNCKAT